MAIAKPQGKAAGKHTCPHKKIRHESRDAAMTALVGMLKKKQEQGTPVVASLRVYGCACGGFHIGRTTGINWDVVNAPVKVDKVLEKSRKNMDKARKTLGINPSAHTTAAQA